MRIRVSSLVSLAGSTIVAVLLGLGGCAGGSKTETPNPDTGAGGSEAATGGAAATAAEGGAAATTTAAGTTGGSTAAAAGGSTSSSTSGPYTCAKGAVTGPKIAPGTNGTWGSASDIAGGAFAPYGDVDASKFAVDTATTPGSVTYTATIAPGGYTGVGLYFKDPQKCWDLSKTAAGAATTGITMTLSGDLGGGKLQFQIQTNSDYPIDAANKKGACEGSWSSGCGNATSENLELTATATPTAVAWTSMTSGQPAAFDPSEILGIQWQVNCPSDATANCVVTLTVGEVTLN